VRACRIGLSVLVSEIVATSFRNENELPSCIKTGNVFGLLGHYWLLKWKFLSWCCVVILKESGSEGVDCIERVHRRLH